MTKTRETVTFEYLLNGELKATEQKLRTVYWRRDGTGTVEVLGRRKPLENRGGKLVCSSFARSVPLLELPGLGPGQSSRRRGQPPSSAL